MTSNGYHDKVIPFGYTIRKAFVLLSLSYPRPDDRLQNVRSPVVRPLICSWTLTIRCHQLPPIEKVTTPNSISDPATIAIILPWKGQYSNATIDNERTWIRISENDESNRDLKNFIEAHVLLPCRTHTWPVAFILIRPVRLLLFRLRSLIELVPKLGLIINPPVSATVTDISMHASTWINEMYWIYVYAEHCQAAGSCSHTRKMSHFGALIIVSFTEATEKKNICK